MDSPKQFFNARYADKSYFRQFKEYDNEKDLLIAWVEQWKNYYQRLLSTLLGKVLMLNAIG